MIDRLLHLQHRLNPLHVYCRFLDKGSNKTLVVLFCKSYEVLVFGWLSWMLKLAIHCCCLLHKDLAVRDELRSAVIKNLGPKGNTSS